MIALALVNLAFAAPLQLEQVLGGLDARSPQLAAAEARVVEAEAKVLASRGAFDPVLDLSGDAEGFVDGELGVLTPFGPSLSAGGSWEGQAVEPWVQVEVPLLEDLIWNEERLELQQSLTAGERAAWKLADEQVKARASAAEAWWTWSAYGEVLQLRADQLQLATTRARALERQVEEGSRAGIDLVDNERVVLERRTSELSAQRQVEQAALKLSLWWRDDSGARVVADASQLPGLPRASGPAQIGPLRAALDQRPDLQALARGLEFLELELRQDRSQRLPELDATLGWSPSGGATAGLALSHPLPNRKARGTLRALEAALEAGREDLRLATERAHAELEAAWVGLERERERERLAERRVQLSAQVLEAERRRFELGSADLFRLVLREDELAKARLEHLKARLDLGLAVVRLEAAAGVR